MGPVSRRAMLTAGLGTVAAMGAGAIGAGAIGPEAYAAPARPAINPRADWAGGRAAKGRLAEEDVRFLIVHHSESPNSEKPGSIPARLRGFFDYHTGPKGWPDVAYNFFVDPFGGIWEGRTGSLAGPVRGDATGGSQGFAQLCCFVGDHTAQPPTEAAMTAMTGLVAWLADRYRIDLAAGTSIGFSSRGSNRWPKGTQVTTDPVVGHRDMSRTSCPGEALYPLVRSRILPGAQALSGRRSVPTATPTDGSPSARESTPPTSPAARTRSPAPTSSPAPSSSSTPAAGEQPAMTPTPAATSAAPVALAENPGLVGRLGDLAVPVAVGAGVLGVGVVAGGVIIAQKDG